METLEQYFERRDTPTKGSPVGQLIANITNKFPELSFDQCRKKAHELLLSAAKHKDFRLPAVRSAEGEAIRKAQFAAFTKSRKHVSSVAVEV